MNTPTTKQLEDVARHGTYFNPASDHYKNPDVILCDKCHKSNLQVCIGYQDMDLCLDCVKSILDQQGDQDTQVRTLMMSSPTNPSGLMTKMETSSAKPIPVTRMLASCARPLNDGDEFPY